MAKQKASLGHVFKTIILPRKNLIILGLFLIILSRLASLVLPWSSQYIIDNVTGPGDIQELKTLLIGVVAAILIQSVTSFALTRLLSVEAQHLIAQLRVKVQKE